MPSPRTWSCIAGSALLVLTFGGCSVTRDEEPSESRASERVETEPTPTETPTTPTPTPAPTSTAPTASVTPTPTASGPEAILLAASELPGLNDEFRWTEQRTGAAGTDGFGLCQKFDLNSIGAMDTRERVFTGDGASAGQQVAEFADAQTAGRASKVLQSWHADCGARVRGRKVRVGPISNVTVDQGRGWHYLVSYTRAGEGHFDALGHVVDGTRLTLIRMAHTGQDHNYDPGQDPMEVAVKAAAAKLG